MISYPRQESLFIVMNELLDTLLWRQFWQITLLIPVVVLFVRYVLPKSPHIAYGILLLVLVKAIFPPIWDSPTGVLWEMVPFVGRSTPVATASETVSKIQSETANSGTFEQRGAITVPLEEGASNALTSTAENKTSNVEASRQVAMATSKPIPWRLILFGIWLAGVLSLLGYILGKRAQLLRFHKDTQVPASDELLEAVELVSADLGLLHVPKVLVTLHPTVPFASGFFQQIVVLPSHVVERTDFAEIKLILAHEMTHLRRGDTLVGLLQLIVQVLWWFHPLVYWLNREVRRIREECCDTDVVTQLNCQPANYARCLLNMLELHQQLRPSKELVGLSPLEVTAMRMQNIMRTPKRKQHRLSQVLYSLSLIVFASLILPASASSSITPKVIVGDLEPPDAKQTITKSESRRPRRKPRSKKIPQPESNPPSVRKDVAPSAPDEAPSPEFVPPVKSVKYKYVRGGEHPYQIKIEAKYPTEIRTHVGAPTFRVDAYAAGLPAFSRQNEKFINSVIPREGVQLPTLSSEFDSDARDPGSLFAPPSFGRSFSPFAEETPTGPVSGSNGHVNPTNGQLPYLLGSLESWVFPQLPPDVTHDWEEEFQREITLSSGASSSAPFSSPHQENLYATIQVQMAANSVTEKEVIFTRVWTLKTTELANEEPRREISLVGKIHFDIQRGVPASAKYTGKLVEREPNREYRIPLSIEIEHVD